MNAEAWIALVSGVAGFVVGGIGLVVAVRANQRADESNRIAHEANALSNDANDLSSQANEIADRALASTERLGEAQIEVGKLSLDEARKAHQQARRADLRVLPNVPRNSNRNEFTITVENRGPHHADNIRVSLHRDGKQLTVGPARTVASGRSRPFVGRIGNFLSPTGTDQTAPSRTQAQVMKLQVEYLDGNGPQVLWKLLRIGPGSQFVSREWSIDDWSGEQPQPVSPKEQ